MLEGVAIPLLVVPAVADVFNGLGLIKLWRRFIVPVLVVVVVGDPCDGPLRCVTGVVVPVPVPVPPEPGLPRGNLLSCDGICDFIAGEESSRLPRKVDDRRMGTCSAVEGAGFVAMRDVPGVVCYIVTKSVTVFKMVSRKVKGLVMHSLRTCCRGSRTDIERVGIGIMTGCEICTKSVDQPNGPSD